MKNTRVSSAEYVNTLFKCKRRVKYLMALLTLAVLLCLFVVPVERITSRPKPKISTQTKIILLNPYMPGKPWYDSPENATENFLSTLNCTISNCMVTYDKNLLEISDVVLFHASNMPHADHLRQLRNTTFSQRQRWGYFMQESPQNTADPTPLHGLFNLTLTYRKDSDVWVPYSRYLPLSDGEARPDIEKNYAKNKRPGVAWIVSHCGLVREQYVLKLQEMYPVHVGGRCKDKYKKKISCKNDCLQYITGYKFYLAFENGFCQEYITEKYWFNALEYESVPIVMGAGPYDNGEHGAVPGSYINAKDFKTIKELANYLHYLDKNDTAYNEYFEWKQKYKVYSDFPSLLLCPLCELIQGTDHKMADLTSFWGRVLSCNGHDDAVKQIIARS